MKQLILCFFALIWSSSLFSINLRISEFSLLDTLDGGVHIGLRITWDNSWNDSLNHDGVYIFGKYEGADGLWHTMHLSLSDVEVLSEGYACDSLGVGLLLRRSSLDGGRSDVRMRFLWRCSSEPFPLRSSDVFSGVIPYSIEGMEMVYVPSLPFYRVGAGFNDCSFGILPSHLDLIGSSSIFSYSSSSGGVASRAADRVDNAFYTSGHLNDWYGVAPCWWRVDFKSARRILYFGVSSLCNSNTYPGGDWYLLGSNDAFVWDTLWIGGSDNWSHSSVSYPVQRSLRVTRPGFYRYYELFVPTVDSLRAPYWGDVYLTNVSMTESDLSKVCGGRVFLEDGSLGSLPGFYPGGYGGFYAMKYELTQDQYVSFLNKLSVSGQYLHTIGGSLDGLREGDYVFGGDAARASHRNGIVLKRRPCRSGERYVFGCRLTPGQRIDSAFSGGMVACNYLSIEDMLSYACWSGLRPLSELEYEKMCVRPYPWLGSGDDYAWGDTAAFFGRVLLDGGGASERFSSGNVNGGGVFLGPVRVGMFEGSRGVSGGVGSGSSFWGIDGLSGNLEEIYSTAGVYGRMLNGRCHGSGELDVSGRSVVSTVDWCPLASGYGTRGGSYASGREGLRIGNRDHAVDYFGSLTERLSTVGVRLGHTVDVRSLRSSITLSNGSISATGSIACDTVCSGGEYVLRGSDGWVPGCVYSWYRSEDGGESWELIVGATRRDLLLHDLTAGVGRNELRRYLYRRLCSGGGFFSESGDAELLVGWGYSVERYRDTLQPCHESMGFTVRGVLGSDYVWRCIDTGRDLLQESQVMESHCGVRSGDFLVEGVWAGGRYTVELEVRVLGRCIYRESLYVDVVPYTDSPFSSLREDFVYSGDVHALENLWSGEDRQRWRLLNAARGTLNVDSVGRLSGLSGTLCSHVMVEAVCADFPDKIYKKEVHEKSRDLTQATSYTLTFLPGDYMIECYGAGGGVGYGSANPVGLGGYCRGEIKFEDSRLLYVYVGEYGNGQSTVVGFNGGGKAWSTSGHNGGRGGGATDIRLVGGAWNNAVSLRSRIMVAGGGGGAMPSCGGSNATAGHGGGLVGTTSWNRSGSYVNNTSYGGSQTAGGGFKLGSNASNNGAYGGLGYGAAAGTCAGGGGSGYYGGGSLYTSGGGGGSSFISGYPGCDAMNESGVHTGQPNHYSGLVFQNPYMEVGKRNGTGLVRITIR